MKKILTQYVDSNKFLTDTIYSKIPDFDIYGVNIHQNLYKTVFRIQPDYILFSGHHITNEIISFLDDYGNNNSSITTIFMVWLDDYSYKQVNEKYNVKHIIPINTNDPNGSETNIIHYPHNLLNTNLYYHKNTQSKQESIIGFLEKTNDLPQTLIDNLYPNKKMPIKLFNNKSIQTVHNLGKITEQEKAELLQKNKYYLNLNHDYDIAANACGCIVISLDQLDKYQTLEYKQILDYTKHSQFLMEYILT